MSNTPSAKSVITAVQCGNLMLRVMRPLRQDFFRVVTRAERGMPVGDSLNALSMNYTTFRDLVELFGQEYDRLAAWWIGNTIPEWMNASSYFAFIANGTAWFLAVDRLAQTYRSPAIILLGQAAQSPILGNFDLGDITAGLASEADSVIAGEFKRKRGTEVPFPELVARTTKEVSELFDSLSGPQHARKWTPPFGFQDPWDSTSSECMNRSVGPKWVSSSRRLYFDGHLVRDYSTRAAFQQEHILDIFEEKGWPRTVVVNLRGKQLKDTIRSLNNGLTQGLIHFRPNGMGNGVLWEPSSEFGNSSP